ncbi:AAA family ATPase [Fadolivirus algeromassiliense]|jgi:hypothetical protein|uniref:AAA family ATPase n=1 Tax=Fadolivirus FV1/VV64 TaxID=3070911 RepID=A0A7D3QWF7_9VIRU|nr:AAA family ATPase [Fadolivirus algeromassiliense]QKF93580.1 AAA family ATPase [Fadolivirus FV1/VV64]
MSTIAYKYENQYDTITKFAVEHSLQYVIFNRADSDSFINLFRQIHENETIQYEYNSQKYEPFYGDTTTVSINENLLDKSKPSKIITFTIQSLHKDELKYVSHIKEYDINYPLIYDIVFGPSINMIRMFYEYLKIKCKKSTKNQIHVWNAQYGQYQLDGRKSYDKSITDLFGLEEYYNSVANDIERYKKHKDMLIKLGASNGLNYMLYGPPGTGKSSFIRAIASEYGFPLYIAKLTMAVNENQITNMLIPYYLNDGNNHEYNHDNNNNFMVVLIEDFDRYLELQGSKTTMSAVLNALDGVFPSFNIIRFFSANNPNIVNNNEALASRMTRVMHFGLPNYDEIKSLILNAYPNESDNPLLDQTINELNILNLSMRQYTYYVCRFLDSENPLQDILDNKEKWIDDTQHFNQYKDTFNKNNTKGS